MPDLHSDGGSDEVVGRLAEGLIANPRRGKSHAADVCIREVDSRPHRTCMGARKGSHRSIVIFHDQTLVCLLLKRP